ncbi:MAG: DNA internalization-related competence protein ComEC/Rec2 [Gammaproteobacteria bacterium]|nr:DNA internalization-related competence protein ComEC/Rec2 [Gammaproteobacteria bacterium]
MDHAARTPLHNPEAWTHPAFGVAAASALLAGVGTCLWLPALPSWLLLALLFALGSGLWLNDGRGRLVGALLLGFGLAGLHASSTLAQQLPPAAEQRDVIVSGRILELPRHETRRSSFLLRVDAGASQPPHLRGKKLRLAWYDDYRRAVDPDAVLPRHRITAGSRWRLSVRLRAPRGLRNPGGFDSEKHALAQRIAATGYLRDGNAIRLAPPRGIDAWRERMAMRIAQAVVRPSSRFVRALALGDTRALDDRDWETLRATGLIHLIAISGFHVGLVAGFLALSAGLVWRLWPTLGKRVPRPQAAAFAALLGALLYAGVAGFALPTVRTALMIAVVVAARLLRRPQRVCDALALAAVTVLLIDPLVLLTAGFWLSFAGVAWLLWCLPHVAAPSARTAVIGKFLSAQGVATLGLLPLTVVLFGQASLAGPFANLLAIPWWSLVVVPLALLGTALEALYAGAGAWLWQLAAVAFDPSWWLFERLAQSPLALWWLPEPRWFALPLAVLGAFWLLLPRGVPGKTLALLLWLPLLWPQRDLPRHGEAELVVIDVGQGLSVLVRTAHHTLLYDMGPATPEGFDSGERIVVPALHALGVDTLHAAVVSHGDNDHAGGFDAVARAFPPRWVFTPEGAPLQEARPCRAGSGWQWDGVRFRFLHPPRSFPYLGNEASCVLRIETMHGAALLTGDIGEVIERDLLRRAPADARAEIVVVGHHGSGGSSGPEFVGATGARYALVSAGYGNRFRHPKPDVVARWQQTGATVLTTLDTGALRARLTAAGISVRTRRMAQARLWDAAHRAGRQ